jgi:hypothetical protein
MKKVLIAHNCGDPHDKALKVGVDLAGQMGADLCVLSVVLELNIAELADQDKRRVLDASKDESRVAVKQALAPKDMNAHGIDFIVEYGNAHSGLSWPQGRDPCASWQHILKAC